VSTEFRRSSYQFTYGTPLLDRILLMALVAAIWAGSVFELREYGFEGNMFAKIASSAGLLYLIWHFFASLKPREIRFGEAGMDIPNTWLPGILDHHVPWREIVDVDLSGKNGLLTICLYMTNRRSRHIYTKGVTAYRRPRLVSNPDQKLFVYLCDVVGIAK